MRASRRRLTAVAAAVLTILLVFGNQPSAHAGILRGLLRVVGGVLELPRSVVAGTLRGPFIIGTLGGVVGGTLRGIGLITAGTIETGLSTAGMALKYVPLLPIFL